MSERSLEINPSVALVNISQVKTIVRTWYGNLPVEILVLNKNLQKAIMDFEKMCDRGSFDFLSLADESLSTQLTE